jgi:hypothetical protein
LINRNIRRWHSFESSLACSWSSQTKNSGLVPVIKVGRSGSDRSKHLSLKSSGSGELVLSFCPFNLYTTEPLAREKAANYR